MICDYCGNVQPIESAGPWAGSIVELDFQRAVQQRLAAEDIEETRVVTCPNCGAQFEFDPDIHAAECPFCATPVVTDTGAHRHIKPRGVQKTALMRADGHPAVAEAEWLSCLDVDEFVNVTRSMVRVAVSF